MTSLRIPETGITVTEDDVLDWRSANARLQIIALANIKSVDAFPESLSSKEEWEEVIEEMIQGFIAVLELDGPNLTSDEERYLNDLFTRGMAFYTKHYADLWV